MKTFHKLLLSSLALAFLSLPMISLSCSSTPAEKDAPIAGATLWQQQCNRCHEYRTPAAYDDSQWETIMLHMQTRANIPAEDAEVILEFLKSAN